jgi:hypothetical protein
VLLRLGRRGAEHGVQEQLRAKTTEIFELGGNDGRDSETITCKMNSINFFQIFVIPI